MENRENKDLQDRREFFKEAAKKALPVIGAVVLLSNPVLAKAMQNESLGCNNGCTGSCQGCRGGCTNQCTGCGSYCSKNCSAGCAKTSY